ncbi:MAG: DUF4874 domain-containing protein [Oscillospiraceae bacterium]|jgi:hypothetical protein|nr:DUF4874 domain-containing protein [Oscillospiraceae bacterium]
MRLFKRKTQPSDAPWPTIGKTLPALAVATEFDNTKARPMPPIARDNAALLLTNPDRGLRHEICITLGDPPCAYPGSADEPLNELHRKIALFQEDAPTVAQLYVYLSRYARRPLDDRALAQMEQMLTACRENGLRVLLRFAYGTESVPDAPWRVVRRHLTQIGDWMRAHTPLVADTVAVLQAGLVGAWGEGHSYQKLRWRQIGKAFNKLLSVTPDWLFVQVRTQGLSDMIDPRWRARLALHDDYLIGDQTHQWNWFGGTAPTGTQWTQVFSHAPNDAEMPWGRALYLDKPDGYPLNNLDAEKLAQQSQFYHLSTLSLMHNYKEDDIRPPYSLQRWKDVWWTADQLAALGLPHHPALLTEGKINAYEYLRQHLGYLLAVQSAGIDGDVFFVTMRNYGFAAPHTLRSLSLVIDGRDEYAISAYSPQDFAQQDSVTYAVTLPEGVGERQAHNISLRLAPYPGAPIAVRFANDTDWTPEDGQKVL